MGKNQQMIKLFVVLFLGTAFIFNFSHFGAKAFENFTNADGKFSNGTTIGAIDISGKTKSEVNQLLTNRYSDWLKNTVINLQYTEKTGSMDLKNFNFDIKTTIASIKDGQNNLAYITIDKLKVEEQIQLLFPQINYKEIAIDKLVNSLTETASKLENGSFNFDLYSDYLLAGNKNNDAIISTVTLKLTSTTEDLQELIEQTSKIEIPGQSTFSFLEFANKQHIENFSSLDILATGIYHAILPTNFSIVERNISSRLPGFAGLGYEAKVDVKKNADLIITNPNKAKYSLEFQLQKDKNLKVTLKGEKFLYKYKISKKNKQLLVPKTIIQYSPLLLPGQTKLQSKGKDGQIVRVYREIYDGSQLQKSELISEDYYPPIYRVEIHSLTGKSLGTSSNQTNTGNVDQSGNNAAIGQSGDQSTQTNDSNQQNSNDSNLWGKPNEQSK
ncbi:G5 domain-containing protein [Neobacillus cucumis]|uniref:G5 domain-containing protein n=1 Tax=Neobacillus cucumis TaxID=1740721 RepID=UPI0018E00796|nr:G5 domain-containing protein [Neobacillus cucumis]MBI0576516.1 G5 domain-containing protein [Neobacillus cucumis]